MSRLLTSTVAVVVAGAAWLAPSAALAQENGFGQFLAQREMLVAIVAECGRRDPKTGQALEARLADWKQAHQEQLAATDQAMQNLSEDNRETVEAALKPMREMASTNLDVAEKQDGLAKACDEAFADFSANLATGRFDARNLGEAEGMYKVTMITEERLGPWCLQKAPETREEIQTAQAQWHEKEGGIQALVRTAMDDAARQDPVAIEQMIKQANAQVDAVFSAVEKLGPEGIAAYCRKEYADIAGDGKRAETPKVYQFLDEAVEAGKQ